MKTRAWSGARAGFLSSAASGRVAPCRTLCIGAAALLTALCGACRTPAPSSEPAVLRVGPVAAVVPMPAHARYAELPLGSVRPRGWIRRFLEIQRDGLTGHLEAAGFPFDTYGWAGPQLKKRGGDDWWPYEQTAYWVDGLVRCGHLIDSPELLGWALPQLEYVLEHADEGGYLGPEFLKPAAAADRWPHAVFFRAFMAQGSATGDPRIAAALSRHFLSDGYPYSGKRDVCNIEAMLWAYAQTGDARLLGRARAAYLAYNAANPDADNTTANMASREKFTEHGVTFNETAKLAAILYMHTGEREYLDAVVEAYRKVDRDHMLADGVPSSCEQLTTRGPLDSHETCDITDYTWSVGYLLMATGDAGYADRIERAMYNAFPGAVRSDFRALQYFSSPNQVVVDSRSNHNRYHYAENWMQFSPSPSGVQCCPGNVNRALPNFAGRMWLADSAGRLTAALYGPCRVSALVGPDRVPVTVVEETDYPFSGEISFIIDAPRPVRMGLRLRVPGWCSAPELALNGKPEAAVRDGGWLILDRRFAPGDRVVLHLPMPVELLPWLGGGATVRRGPLVFSLAIEERWEPDKAETRFPDEFPAWSVSAGSPWNYALAVDADRIGEQVSVVERPAGLEPWAWDNALVELYVPARRVPGWTLIEKDEVTTRDIGTVKGEFRFTPALPSPEVLAAGLGEPETVRLIPYGCARLRITCFPLAP